MIRNFYKAVALVAAVLGVAIAAQSAQAGMIPTSVSVTPDGSDFRWTYAVVVTTDVKVNPGDYFTIYDFGGLAGTGAGNSPGPGISIVSPVGWSVGTAMVGPTPPGTNPADDPGIINLTFTYSGDPINSQQGLGNFTALSQLFDR